MSPTEVKADFGKASILRDGRVVFNIAGNKYRLVVWINTLKEIESLMTAKLGTPEGERQDVLATLVEDWERKHFPMDLPDPIEAIRFVMDQRDLTVQDFEPLIGRSKRVYEVLGRKRPLTLKMIWRLHTELGIPAESLIRQAEESRAA